MILIRLFFEFLHETNGIYKKMDIVDFPMSILDEVGREDVEEYMEYLSLYVRDGQEITNDERGKARKLASLRSFYNYFFRLEKQIAQVVEEKKEKQKLYRCVGILSGLFLVILLL